MWNNLYTNLMNKKFSDIYGDAETFIADYKTIPIPQTITEMEATTLYYLLYGRFGNSTISSSDENRFKYNLFGTIFSYAPAWARKVSLQDSLRKLTDDELRAGSSAKHNHAFNPSSQPTTDIIKEINEQNTTDYQKDKMSAYGMLDSLLATDVTQSFLDKFKKLFRTGVVLGVPLWYVTENKEDENND